MDRLGDVFHLLVAEVVNTAACRVDDPTLVGFDLAPENSPCRIQRGQCGALVGAH
jgi:hypothetical protein